MDAFGRAVAVLIGVRSDPHGADEGDGQQEGGKWECFFHDLKWLYLKISKLRMSFTFKAIRGVVLLLSEKLGFLEAENETVGAAPDKCD